MVSHLLRAVADPRRARTPLTRAINTMCLMSIGVTVCLALAACGGRDDDASHESSATSNAASPQSSQSPQSDSPTDANATRSASNGLAPPVMHYAQ